jgi:hypothetical protein
MAGRTLAYARAAFSRAEKRGKVPTNPFQGLPISAGTTASDLPEPIRVGSVNGRNGASLSHTAACEW